MIRTFADQETERVWNGVRSRKLPADIQQVARRKLRQLDVSERLDELASPRGNRLEQLKGLRLRGIACASTISGGSAFAGRTEARTMSGSKTITEGDLLDNVHPGDILREDFLVGSDIPLEEVALGAGVDTSRLRRLLDGAVQVDADLDLRLGRYFGMSEGFFLRLQNSYDLEQVRRINGAELDRIVRRAA